MKGLGSINFQLLLLAFLLGGHTRLHAQKQVDTSAVLTMAEISPEFPGGEKALYEFIGIHLEYPSEVANLGITGRVVVSFVVNTDGGLSDIKVLRGVHQQLDEEAKRVIHKMPQWKPGEQKGTPVRVQKILPINFKLETLPPDKDSVYSIVSSMPVFPGGHEGLAIYLDTALNYPELARKNRIQGSVHIECIINKKGEIEEAKIVKGLGWNCEEEALRIVKEMPQWKPGTVNKEPVKVRQTFALVFKLGKSKQLGAKSILEGYNGAVTFDRELMDSLQKDSTLILPNYPGGAEAFQAYLDYNITYPEAASYWREQGRVVVAFTVMPDGSIAKTEIFQSSNPVFNEEALRVFGGMPNWEPAEVQGQPIPFRIYLPIEFR